jgi:hypothetical protein
MLLCPTCGREFTNSPVCKCGTDLSLLHQIVARVDHLFNQALAAYRASKTARALEYLEANAALVPFDVEARVVQIKLLGQLKRWEEVEVIIQHIQESAPAHPELEPLLKVLAEANGENGEVK